MASYVYTFNSGDGVTPTRLNAARTVSNIVNADIDNAAAIDKTKISGTAITAADTGTVTSAMIADGTIVNADINASAAIAGTKITPDFGGQNVVTTGNVGVGTSATSGRKVDIVGGSISAGNSSTYAIGIANIGGANADVTIGSDGTYGYLQSWAGKPLYVNSQGNNVLVGSGNVGIGTSSPSVKLDVNGAIKSANLLVQGDGTHGYIRPTNASSALFLGSNNTNQAVIDATGNVGIGTSSPTVKLDVSGVLRSVGQAIVEGLAGTFRFFRLTTNGVVRWDVGATDGSESGSNAGSDFFLHRFSDAGAFLERVLHVSRATGNVGIGTSSPSTKLEVAGTVTATAFSGPLTGTASAIADGSVSTAKIVDGAVTDAKLATATQQSLVPAGAVMPFAMNSAPAGWLAADGTAVSRSTYAALFAAISTTHGSGDGSTTFNLPDLRGIFVRGSGSQTISGTTYSGTFAGKQQDSLKSHTHGYTDAGVSQKGLTGGPTPFASTATTDRTTDSTGGTETRPANVALLYCIKF